MATKADSWEGDQLDEWVQNNEPLYLRHEEIRQARQFAPTKVRRLITLYSDAREDYLATTGGKRIAFSDTLIRNLARRDVEGWRQGEEGRG